MRIYGCLYPDVPALPRSVPLVDGSGSWTVTSDRWPDVSYTVTCSPDGHWGCDCPGARYEARADGLCKHVERVRGWLASDPLAAQAAAVLCWLQEPSAGREQ
jgi:hypothetical protein